MRINADFFIFVIQNLCEAISNFQKMSKECRLCGVIEFDNELVITLECESENVTFADLIEYFCRINLDRKNSSLSQEVCRKCKCILENFMYFCDGVEKHQQLLKEKSRKESPKPEKTQNNQCIYLQSNHVAGITESYPKLLEIAEVHSAATSHSNSDLPFSKSEPNASLTDHSNFNLRKKSITVAPPEMKNCSIVLEKLEIEYETSDTESEEETCTTDFVSKRPLESPKKSPSNSTKRMRVTSPIKLKLV